MPEAWVSAFDSLSEQEQVLLIAQDFSEEMSQGANLISMKSFRHMTEWAERLISWWPWEGNDVDGAAYIWPRD